MQTQPPLKKLSQPEEEVILVPQPETELAPELVQVLTSTEFTLPEPTWSDLIFRKSRTGYRGSLHIAARYVLLPAPGYLLEAAKDGLKTLGSAVLLTLGSAALVFTAPAQLVGRSLKVLFWLTAGSLGVLDMGPSKARIAAHINKELRKHPRYAELQEEGFKVSIAPEEIPDELAERMRYPTRG